MDTFGNRHKPVLSLGVSQHICKKKKTCENLNSIGRRSWERIIMVEKTPLSPDVVCFQMLRMDFKKTSKV